MKVAQVFTGTPSGRWQVECSDDGKITLKKFETPKEVMDFIVLHNKERFDRIKRERVP